MTRYLVNPLVLFLTVWGTAIALYAGGVYVGLFPNPQPALWVAVLLNVGGFTLGYLTWAAFQDHTPSADLARSHTRILRPETISRMLQFTALMGLVALSLGVYRTAVIASGFGMSLRELLANPGLLRGGFAMFVAAGVSETSGLVMLNSVTNALFSIGFVLLGIFVHVGAGWRKYFYLCSFLLIALAISLTSVSRYEATVNIAYLVFTYCLVRSSCEVCGAPLAGPSRRRPRAVLGVFLALAAVAVLYYIIDGLLQKSAEYDRADRLAGFLYHLFWYLASPLAALHELLTTFDGHFHLGQYTFFPLYKWLCRFHVAPAADISVFGEFVFVPYAANVYTYLRNFYEDFGMIGVVTAPYALGLATCALRARAARSAAYLNLYMVLLVFILFSFYNYFLFSNQVYLQVLFGFLLLRYDLPGCDARAAVPRAAHVQGDVVTT